MHTRILNAGIAAALMCAAVIAAQAQSVYSANTKPQITGQIAVGDASHNPTPDGLYILLSNSEGVAVAQRNQTDNQGRPVVKTFLPHPGMGTYTYFYDGNTRYVATFGVRYLRIYQWTTSSGPESHTGTRYDISSHIGASEITSMGAIKVGDGEGGSFWLIVLGSRKPSKIYTFRLNGSFAGAYDDHGGSGVSAIASDPYHNPPRYARIATAGESGAVNIWTGSGDPLNPLALSKKLSGGRKGILDVSFVPTYASGLAAVGSDRRLYYWDITTPYPTPKHVYNFADEQTENPYTMRLSFSPNGYAIVPTLWDAYWFEMPTAFNPNRFRFAGKRRLVNWYWLYSLGTISSFALRMPPVSILNSSQMLVSFNNAYMTYKEAPWNVYHTPASPPLASCAANAVVAVTTADCRIFVYSQGYVTTGSSSTVASATLPEPAHSIAYLGENGGRYVFIAGTGDSRLRIISYDPFANAISLSGTITTPSNLRGALLVDAVHVGNETMVAVGSPTDGNVLIYRWVASSPTTLTEWNPLDDSDLLSVGYVIRDLRAARSSDRFHIGGAIRRRSCFTGVFDGSFTGRPYLGPNGNGQSFDWNPAEPDKFALLWFGNNAVFVDSPINGPLAYRPEIGSGEYNRTIPWAIRYNDGSSVAISYRTSAECFRAFPVTNGVQFVRSDYIVPERTGTFTTLATRFPVGNQNYWVLGDTNGVVSFALPEAVQQVQDPISISFAYNYAFARQNFYTLSSTGSSTNTVSRFAAIAYSGIAPREPRTHLLRLNQSNPAGYTVEKVLPGWWFLCPAIQNFQSIHTVNYQNGTTERYSLNHVLTLASPTPVQTIAGVHERFSYNGQYCVTQTSSGYNFYRFDGAQWQSHGSISVYLGYATKCYISDTGNYAVVLQDRDRRYCDIYERQLDNSWTLKASLRDRVYYVFNVDHGAWEYGDYMPFVFLPGSNWFCINYDLNPDDPVNGNPNEDPHLLLINAVETNPLNTRVVIGSPSYTFGFIVSGANTYLLRLYGDPINSARLAVYNITNPTSPSFVQDFQREVNLSGGFPQPIVGNYGFGMFNSTLHGVFFNYPSSSP